MAPDHCGLFMNGQTAALFINLGILLFSAAVLFQLVTLPVEFNASGRAVKVLESSGMLYPDEVSSVKKVLGAAALTYVASAAAMILQLLRLLNPDRRKKDGMTKTVNEREIVLGILMETVENGQY